MLRIDYSGLSGEEIVPLVASVPAFYRGRAKGSVLALIDLRETRATEEAVAAMKQLVKTTTREYDRKVALLGISGVKKAILITVNLFTGHNMQSFDRELDGLDWLIS